MPQNLKVPASGKKDMHGTVAIFKLPNRFSDFVLPKFLVATLFDFSKICTLLRPHWAPNRTNFDFILSYVFECVVLRFFSKSQNPL